MTDTNTAAGPGTAAGLRLAALADGYLTTQLLYVAAKLGVADVLAAAGPCDGATVAAAVGADPDAVTRLLRGLSLDDVVVEHPDGSFSLGPPGEYLRDGVPGSQRGPVLVRGEVYARAAQELLGSITTGTVAFERAYGRPFFAHLDAEPSHGAMFEASMAGRAVHEAAAVVAAYDLSGLGRIVDVGAGPGLLTRAALLAVPGLSATLVDRPAMLDRARNTLAEAGLGDRCTFTPGDFFTSVPAGGDAYLLSRILHDWADDDAVRILGACRAAMGPGARLLVVDAVLPERAADLPAAIRMDLSVLILLGGRERTEGQLRALLERAGFALRRVVATRSPTGLAVLEADPVA